MKVLLFANTGWYLFNFRRSLAESLRHEGYEVLLASPPDEYGPKLAALGFRWIAVPMERRSINPLRELLRLRWLKSLMHREQVQLVHSFTLKCAIYGSLAARAAGVPARINAVAGLGYTFTSNGWRPRALRLIATSMMKLAFGGQGMKLVLQNPDDEAMFRQLGTVTPKAICMIPGSGVNTDKFKPRRVAREPGPLQVLLPARILWDKGVMEFIDAARLVKSKGGNVAFLLAGSPDPGNPTSVPPAKILEWEAEGLVTCLGVKLQ